MAVPNWGGKIQANFGKLRKKLYSEYNASKQECLYKHLLLLTIQLAKYGKANINILQVLAVSYP